MATWTLKDSIGGNVWSGASPNSVNLSNGGIITCDLVVATLVGFAGLTCSITDDAGLTYIPLTAYTIGDVFVQLFYAHGAGLSIPINNNIVLTTTGDGVNNVLFEVDFWTGSDIASPLQTETGAAVGLSPAAPMTLGPIPPDRPESLIYYAGATSLDSTGADLGPAVWPYVTVPGGANVSGSNPSFNQGGANWGNNYIQPFGSFPAPESFSLDGWTASTNVAFAFAFFRSTDAPPPPVVGPFCDPEIWG